MSNDLDDIIDARIQAAIEPLLQRINELESLSVPDIDKISTLMAKVAVLEANAVQDGETFRITKIA